MHTVVEEDIQRIVEKLPYQKMEDKVFLITGANGFLASGMVHVLMYLNRYRLNKKCKVIALCRNKEKAEARFQEYLQNPYFQFCIQGVEEEIQIRSKIDFVVHAAGSSSTRDFKVIPSEILKANVIGTYNLLEFARKRKIESFLYFSSGAVYGEVTEGCDEITEQDYFPLDFTLTESCYAQGKRTGEVFCRSYWEQYKVPVKIIRINHTYGPGIDLDDGHVYSDFIKNICDRKSLFIKGSGSDVRAFCYLSDALTAFFQVLISGKNGEAYNMANCNETVSIWELADKLVSEAFPQLGLFVECDYPKQKECVEKVRIDVRKLMQLGWKPQIAIAEGFQRTVRSIEESRK